MRIVDLFSKRQQRQRGEVPDVFAYGRMSNELRTQVVYILVDYLGNAQEFDRREMGVGRAYDSIVRTLCREYGLFHLQAQSEYSRKRTYEELLEFILQEGNVERVLDAVELACRIIDTESRKWKYRLRNNASAEADAALAELNERFRHHGFGYRFESGNIIRVDSEFIHAEVVKQALALLHDPKYKGAEAEFHLAHEHHRHGRRKEALADCLKALESTIKAIARSRKWEHSENATASALIDLLYKREFIPQFWAGHFSGLRAMLESGVPTVRNRLGGHGQGTDVIEVPERYVTFALHQTAAAIVFLASTEREAS